MALENFLNKVSALAKTGVVKGKELAADGVAKAKELGEISKLKMENVTEQEAIRKAYYEIGQIYFASCGENPEEPYAALCEKVRASKAKIEYNEERIADIKAAGNAAGAEETVIEEYFVKEEATAEDFADEEPVAEEAPAEEEAPVAEETPAEEEAPKK